eukprot:117132-Chlamydomonas_euryale.AAC.9
MLRTKAATVSPSPPLLLCLAPLLLGTLLPAPPSLRLPAKCIAALPSPPLPHPPLLHLPANFANATPPPAPRVASSPPPLRPANRAQELTAATSPSSPPPPCKCVSVPPPAPSPLRKCSAASLSDPPANSADVTPGSAASGGPAPGPARRTMHTRPSSWPPSPPGSGSTYATRSPSADSRSDRTSWPGRQACQKGSAGVPKRFGRRAKGGGKAG